MMMQEQQRARDRQEREERYRQRLAEESPYGRVTAADFEAQELREAEADRLATYHRDRVFQ